MITHPQFLGGPYKPPRCRIGSELQCERFGPVEVVGFNSAGWPLCASGRHGISQSLVLCGDLILAVRTEAEQFVAEAFGVTIWTVVRWRKLLGVPQFNEGTKALWALGPKKEIEED